MTTGSLAGDQPILAEEGKTVSVKLGKEVSFKDGTLRFSFIDVSEDSRCPTGTHCLWAGQAKIVLRLANQSETVELIVPGMQAEVDVTTQLDDYKIHCRGLIPHPTSNAPVEKARYIADITITHSP